MGLVFNNHVSSPLMLVSEIQHTVHCTRLSVFLCMYVRIEECSSFLPVFLKEVFFPYASCLFLKLKGFPCQFFKNLSTSLCRFFIL